MPNRRPRYKPNSQATTPRHDRQTANERGYTYAWQQASQQYLAEHPCCESCQQVDRVTEAECVDHIIPHRGDQTLFWDRSNWQSLCGACHRVKTAWERTHPPTVPWPGLAA